MYCKAAKQRPSHSHRQNLVKFVDIWFFEIFSHANRHIAMELETQTHTLTGILCTAIGKKYKLQCIKHKNNIIKFIKPQLTITESTVTTTCVIIGDWGS